MPTAPYRTYKIRRVDPIIWPTNSAEVTINLNPSTVYPAGTVLGEMIGTDEVQQVVLDATGGVWVYTWNGQSTGNLAWNISEDDLELAIAQLSNVGAGNVNVRQTAALTYRIAFIGALGSANQPAATTTATGLTGGAGTAVVSTLTGGVAGTRGLFRAYASGNSDGSQVAKGILRYACATDAAGNITLGAVAGGDEHGHTSRYTDMWVGGTFDTSDLVGLDATAIGHLGRLLDGTVEKGRLAVA
jgi:hypothetical protein